MRTALRPNTQYPIPNTQYPIPNTQYPNYYLSQKKFVKTPVGKISYFNIKTRKTESAHHAESLRTVCAFCFVNDIARYERSGQRAEAGEKESWGWYRISGKTQTQYPMTQNPK
jgi:hypothetical protein